MRKINNSTPEHGFASLVTLLHIEAAIEVNLRPTNNIFTVNFRN